MMIGCESVKGSGEGGCYVKDVIFWLTILDVSGVELDALVRLGRRYPPHQHHLRGFPLSEKEKPIFLGDPDLHLYTLCIHSIHSRDCVDKDRSDHADIWDEIVSATS
jgi:hypothetical protein